MMLIQLLHLKWTNHLCHAPATALGLLHATTLSPGDLPSNAAAAAVLLSFVAYYYALTIANRLACGLWTYPLIDDAEAMGGKLGIFILFAVIGALVVGLGFAGMALVSKQ